MTRIGDFRGSGQRLLLWNVGAEQVDEDLCLQMLLAATPDYGRVHYFYGHVSCSLRSLSYPRYVFTVCNLFNFALICQVAVCVLG